MSNIPQQILEERNMNLQISTVLRYWQANLPASLLSFLCSHLLSDNTRDCLIEVTPIWISCSAKWQQGLQHSKSGFKKKAAGRFQSCNYFPVLWILLHAAPPLTSVIYKAKRKLQLSTHIMFWLSVFSSCAWLHGEWEGNTWKELGPASKQKKNKTVSSFPALLLDTFANVAWIRSHKNADQLSPVLIPKL